MKSPTVSFVIPCYNYGRFLPDCLERIFGQSGDIDDFEVIAIDDASTDDTLEVLNQWDDSRLKIVRNETNRGHVYTVSKGLEMAAGAFVARIDPDDRYRSNFLSTLLPLFEDDRVGLVYGDAAMIDEHGKLTTELCQQPHRGEPFVGSALIDILHKNYICAPTAIGRREAWRKHLPVWEGLAFNDIYFNMMMARDWYFAYQPEVVAEYRLHGSNHHGLITVNKSEEPSLMRVLDWIFAHPESDPELEREKSKAKDSVYAAHYLDLAEKYFGAGHVADARRCYRRAFLHSPRDTVSVGAVRRFLATLTGMRLYDLSKRLFGQAANPARGTS